MTSVEFKLYLVILFASLISCFVGFSLEAIKTKIHLVQRKQKAKVKIIFFPTLPMVPLSYILVSFGFNLIVTNLGFIIVGVYFGLETMMKLIRLRKLRAQFKRMMPKKKKA